MTDTVFFNEIEPYAAQWCRNIHTGAVVDERSIHALQADDVSGYTRAHFFAGIGTWEYALALAGWPAGRQVWTGSCPCQSFSNAGKRKGFQDDRHLWPEWFRLIRQCHPDTIFGEQVEGAIGHGWLDLVFGDLEAEGYTCGAVVLGAHSVGAPHARQRLYWVAVSDGKRHNGRGATRPSWREEHPNSRDVGVPHADITGLEGRGVLNGHPDERAIGARGQTGGLAYAGRICLRSGGHGETAAETTEVQGANGQRQRIRLDAGSSRTAVCCGVTQGDPTGEGLQGATGGCVSEQIARPAVSGWGVCEFLPCADGKWRPTQPGLCCLVDGVPFRLADGRTNEEASRSGILKAIGNAIVPAVAAVFIRSYMDTRGINGDS